MAIDMTPAERTVGEENFKKATETLGINRRSFLKAGILGAGAVAGSAAAVYYGYQSVQGNPVRTALIGGGASPLPRALRVTPVSPANAAANTKRVAE